MFQLCLNSILAAKAEIGPKIGPKLATHEGLVMHCMSFYFHAISVLATRVDHGQLAILRVH